MTAYVPFSDIGSGVSKVMLVRHVERCRQTAEAIRDGVIERGGRCTLMGPLDSHAGLIVNVTHDWNLMVLLEHCMGLPHEDVGWPAYLDYLLIERNGGLLRMSYHGMTRAI